MQNPFRPYQFRMLHQKVSGILCLFSKGGFIASEVQYILYSELTSGSSSDMVDALVIRLILKFSLFFWHNQADKSCYVLHTNRHYGLYTKKAAFLMRLLVPQSFNLCLYYNRSIYFMGTTLSATLLLYHSLAFFPPLVTHDANWG